MIRLNDLSKKFGSFFAVKNLNLEIKRGEIVGFLGPNGAGKSTTIKMIANLLNPTSGYVEIKGGTNLERLNSKNKNRLLKKVGFLIEVPELYDNVTPRQILKYFAILKDYPKNKIDNRVEETLELIGLQNWKDKKIKTFSKGMRQKIGILSAIIHDPDIIILDEPQTGLDPKSRREVRDFLLKMKDLGKTIFISSHLVYEISEIADKIAIINHGHLVAYDNLENLEQKVKKSVIHLELMEFLNASYMTDDNISKLIQDLKQILRDYVEEIHYNEDAKFLELIFDGEPQNQVKILRELVSQNFSVLEFSVPKTNLLENIYLELLRKSEEQIQKAHIKPKPNQGADWSLSKIEQTENKF